MSVQTITNWNELSFDIKKMKNVKSSKRNCIRNLIAQQREIGNFEYLLNSYIESPKQLVTIFACFLNCLLIIFILLS